MKLFKEFVEDLELDEVLGKDADMGDYIDDFKKSDSPQFKGKSEKKRKEMAIAAYMSKQREETEVDEACWAGYKQVGMKKKGDKQVPNCVPEESKLNELSKKLLKRYSDKASKDIDKRFAGAETEKDREKLAKRLRGYAKGTLKYRDKKEYVNYPYGPLDTMRPMADLGDIPNYYGTKLNAQRKKKKVNRDA